MYLKALTLREFAGVSSLVLADFENGLNVVVGDNEAGKSTVLTALRAAFFQKHRSKGEAIHALLPYGRQVRPEVEISFSTGGTDYKLRKAFLQKPEAELTWPGGRLQGDAVEERLAELLRFSHSAARKPKDGDFVGSFGLLWVDQGRSTQGLDLGSGRDAVTASLEGEVTQVLGGERGRALIAASRARQDRFFTNTLRARIDSPLKLAEERLEHLRGALSQRRSAMADYRSKLQRLADRRSVLGSYVRDDAVGQATASLLRAEAAQRALADLQRECAEGERDLRHALATREHAGERLRQRETLLGDMQRAVAQERDERAALRDDQEALERERRHLAERDEGYRAARARRDEAEQRNERARTAQERRRLAREIERLESQIEAVHSLRERLSVLSRDGVESILKRRDLDGLEEIERSAREAAIRLSAGSPAITFVPDRTDTVVTATGGSAASGVPLTVATRTTFELSGWGSVTIEPGGGAAKLADEAERGRERLRVRLAELGVASVDEARSLVAAAEERVKDVEQLRTLIAARLPNGVPRSEEELHGLREALARLPAPPADGDLEDEPGAALSHSQAARDAATHAEAEFESARRAFESASADLVRREARVAHLSDEARRLRSDVERAEVARAHTALKEDFAAAELERAAREAALDKRRRTLAEGDPETVERTVVAKRRAREEIDRTVAALRSETASLEGELRVQGASALDEEIAKLEGELEETERLCTRLRLEAEASRLLHQTLLQAQREAQESWLAPIKSHVAPYLRLIHPDSDIALDEATLELTGLRRGGVDEDFRRLSAGAREQVAVVTRLALADVIKKGGHPAAVILDDALVNTDERRLERMHHVLRKAAEGLQVIILTCRERDFRDIGAPIFRL